MKCHLMKEFFGKKKGFVNCWPSLTLLILKMVKLRLREGRCLSKISCQLATGSERNLRPSDSGSWKSGTI